MIYKNLKCGGVTIWSWKYEFKINYMIYI